MVSNYWPTHFLNASKQKKIHSNETCDQILPTAITDIGIFMSISQGPFLYGELKRVV